MKLCIGVMLGVSAYFELIQPREPLSSEYLPHLQMRRLCFGGVSAFLALCWTMYLYRVAKYLRLSAAVRWAIPLLILSEILVAAEFVVALYPDQFSLTRILGIVTLAVGTFLSIGYTLLHGWVRAGIMRFMVEAITQRTR